LIEKKRDGKSLQERELRELIARYTEGEVPDYQMAAFLMAVYLRGFAPEELAWWTDAMLRSGDVLDFGHIEGAKIDKHSTGGVGDKISLILAPLAVAAGLRVPMISGRGLGHTGGTLDKLESIPGFRVDLSAAEFEAMVSGIGCGLIGQTGQIAPADKKLYALRDVTGTVSSIPLIASSIMSKKLAEGIDALVLDVKVGSGAFIQSLEGARELARTMINIGASMGCEVRALITDMNQPLGATVGNSLEVIESIETLRGEGPSDVTDLSIELVAEMLDVANPLEDRDACRTHLRELLENGSALAVFRSIIEAQGGDPRVCDDFSLLPSARHRHDFTAATSGWITAFDVQQLGLAALELGAGRKRKEDPINPAVGLTFVQKQGARIEKGEPIAWIHYDEEKSLDRCLQRLKSATSITATEPESTPLIHERHAP
jgi:pyrimidine-nucleoside phosphorylase